MPPGQSNRPNYLSVPSTTSLGSYTAVNSPGHNTPLASTIDDGEELEEHYDDHRPESTYSSGALRQSFRDSTPLIPSPAGGQRPPRYVPISLQVWAIVATILVNVALAITLEVALFISNKNGGFYVPNHNIFPVSPQFLLSFFPTLLVIPVAFLWREMDWMLRWYHPYVVLSRGQALGSETLLLDYIAAGLSYTFIYAWKYKHWLVYWSAQTALMSYIFQPLAGAIFQLTQMPSNTMTNATSLTTIGLQPQADLDQLNAFIASAGYADAAVYNHLPDPPFVWGGWSVGQFSTPDYFTVNGSLTVQTTGIETNVNCGNPSIPPQITSGVGGNLSVTAISTDQCTVNGTFDPNAASQQYGVVDVPCGDTNETNFHRVMFWFFQMGSNNQPEAQAIFCTPSIQAYNVMVTLNLTDNSITNVRPLNNYTTSNNVTGPSLNGKAYNGLLFDTSNQSFIIQSRAVAIQNGIPGTVFRAAQQSDGGLDTVFSNATGWVDLLDPIYTQHLALAGKSIYFAAADNPSPLQAAILSTSQRLIIDPLAGHALAFFLLLIAVIGAIVHIKHRRARQHLHLTAPPGTMAATLAMAARSGFGELLLPYDDEKTLNRKLAGLRVRLDRRTGAITVDEEGMMRIGSSLTNRRVGSESSTYYNKKLASSSDDAGKQGWSSELAVTTPTPTSAARREARGDAMASLIGHDKDSSSDEEGPQEGEVFSQQQQPRDIGSDQTQSVSHISMPTTYPPGLSAYRTPFDDAN